MAILINNININDMRCFQCNSERGQMHATHVEINGHLTPTHLCHKCYDEIMLDDVRTTAEMDWLTSTI